MQRRTFLKGVAAGTAALGFSETMPVLAETSKPNIIYILADDLGYGDLGCFGQKQIKTPNLDRMAREGIKFTDHYAGNTVCAPSRCALMTGYHMGHAYIRNNGKIGLRPSDVTLAEILKDAGYSTALVGKWGLGQEGSDGVPTKQGFDFFFGYLDQRHAHNYYPTFLIKNEGRVQLDNVVPNEDAQGSGKATKRVQYSHDLIMEEGLDFVRRSKDGPFFLYMALTIPHANNEGGKTGDKNGMEVPSYGPYTNEDWPVFQKGTAAMITLMDKDIGRLFALLKSLGIDDNTLVVFSSDNGPHKEGGNDPAFFGSSGPLRGIKRDLYEGGIRVPTMARWPGQIKAGTESDHPSAFWDVLPTFAEIAGAQTPDGIDGISFVPAMLGEDAKQKKHEYLYWDFFDMQALRMGRWKAVRLAQGKPLELYDLRKDVGETDNVAGKNPEIVTKIEKLLAGARTESELWPLARKKRTPQK